MHHPARTLHGIRSRSAAQVHHILRKMEETGVDFFADVHGDEELTYNFIAVCARSGLDVQSLC